jgi:polysaccharide biosynthesis/export protein
MRRARFLVVASVALAVSGCARDAQYVEQVSPPANVPHRPAASMYSSSPAYAQQAQEQTGSLPSVAQSRPDNNRGLFTSQSAAPISTAQSTPKPAPAPPPQQMPADNNRGLFGSRSAAPVYAAQPPQQSTPAPAPKQTATDNNRGMFTSRWAAAFDSAPVTDQRQVPVTRVTSAPRPAHDADVYERTGSLPSQTPPAANKKRGWFPSSADESFDSTQPAPQSGSAANKTQPAPRPIPAARMYTSSAASAQQAYEQPPPQAQEAPVTSNARGLFTTRSAAPGYAAQPAAGGPYVAPSYGYASASVPTSAPAASETVYTLGVGDKLRIVVFGQDGISNTYIVDAAGKVNMPLIGAVPARGLTNQQLSDAVAARLKQGYVREPHVTVEVETYRPFFILGEVTTPGQYPYVVNMTAETAVAIAGGFAPRAFKKTVELTRKSGGQQTRSDVPLDYVIRPGDTIVVKERWF